MPIISSTISRVSAAVLLCGGLALLFGADVLLPVLAPGTPASAAWLGQLLGAAWLALAALNWLQRFTLIGGIYARGVVMANATLYFITALSALRAISAGGARVLLIAVPASVLALVYGALLFRGPFDALAGAREAT